MDSEDANLRLPGVDIGPARGYFHVMRIAVTILLLLLLAAGVGLFDRTEEKRFYTIDELIDLAIEEPRAFDI